MPDADAVSQDRLPQIVICDYDVEDPVWDPVEDLSGTHWRPAGALTLTLAGDEPDRLFEAVAGCLRNARCRALLLVGRTPADGFRVQMRAENRSLAGKERHSDALPSLARSTLPVAHMVEALNAAGLPAKATSEAEPDAGSYLLFRTLSESPDALDTPAIGLLRVPANASEAQARQAVKTAASVIAAQLAPMARTQYA